MRPMSRAIKAVDDTSKRLLEVVSLGAGAAVTAEVNELNKVCLAAARQDAVSHRVASN